MSSYHDQAFHHFGFHFTELLVNHQYLIPKLWDEIMFSKNLEATINGISKNQLGRRGCTHCMIPTHLDIRPHIADLVILCRLAARHCQKLTFHMIDTGYTEPPTIRCDGYWLYTAKYPQMITTEHKLGSFLQENHPTLHAIWMEFHAHAAH